MIAKSFRKAVCTAACVVAGGAGTAVMATAHVDVPASSVQIQSNGSTNPTIFYTGSVCSGQHLNLDANSPVDVQKQLWAAVLTAKATGAKLGFDYDFNGDICLIRSFAVLPN